MVHLFPPVLLELTQESHVTSFKKFQQQLLEESRYAFLENPLSVATEQAFLATPRHLFVKRYRLWASPDWHDVDDSNLEEHLPTLYHDRPLILLGDDDENTPSTISDQRGHLNQKLRF